MARQRATQARDAFARVGTAQVSSAADDNASLPATEIDGDKAGIAAADKEVGKAGIPASVNAVGKAGGHEIGKAGRNDAAKAGRKAGRPRRRVGRPRGPDRVPLTVRILAATDDRLTAAVRMTGESPQYVVDAALAAYFDALGV